MCQKVPYFKTLKFTCLLCCCELSVIYTHSLVISSSFLVYNSVSLIYNKASSKHTELHYFTMFCCLLFFSRSSVCCMFLLVILTQSLCSSYGPVISVFFFLENKSDRGSAGKFLKTQQHKSHKHTVYTTVWFIHSLFVI